MAATQSTKLKKPQPAAGGVAPKRARIDWDAIKRDFRTNKYTDDELAARHHVARETIVRRRTREGDTEWPKDLGEAIKKATDAALVMSLVTDSHTKVTDVIKVAAEIGKDVILSHRRGLQRITNVKIKLLEQIEQAAQNMADLAQVIEMVRKPDDSGVDKVNDALRKAMGRSALVDDLKKLADVDEKVRKGEREAFDLDDAPPPPPEAPEVKAASRFDAFIAKMDKLNAPA